MAKAGYCGWELGGIQGVVNLRPRQIQSLDSVGDALQRELGQGKVRQPQGNVVESATLPLPQAVGKVHIKAHHFGHCLRRVYRTNPF